MLSGMDSRTIPVLSGTPIVGHILELRRRPVEFLQRAALVHPEIARLRCAGFDVVAISEPALVHAVLVAQADAFIKENALTRFAEPLLGRGLLTLDGPAHRRRRKLAAPAFMPKRVLTHAADMTHYAERAADRMAADGSVDLAEACLQVALEITSKALFGVDVSGDSEPIARAVSGAIGALVDATSSFLPLPPPMPTPANLRLRRAVRELDALLYPLIHARRSAAGEQSDLLSALLAGRTDDGTPLGDRELRDEAVNLFLAGHETTADALAWTLFALATHPNVYAQVEREVDALPALTPAHLTQAPQLLRAVHEAMRLYPPVYMTSRRAVRDVRLGDYEIARGCIVLVNIFGMHHRPDLFPEPQAFDPERFATERSLPRGAFVPFGGGARMCIGSHFALLELQLVLSIWLRRLRFELVDPAQQPAFEPLVSLRPQRGILMRVVRREQPAGLEAGPTAAELRDAVPIGGVSEGVPRSLQR